MNSRLDQGSSRARLVPRFVIFGIAVAIVVVSLGLRLFDLQVARGGYYQTLSQAQQTTTIPVKTSRGLIYDRKGRLVADNVPTFAVKVRPADLPADQREAVTGRLGQILDMPPQQIIETIDSSIGSDFDLVTIKDDIATETARVIAQDHLDLPGVYVDVEARRQYLYGPLLSHILGFEGAISGSQYATLKAQGYQNDDWVGKAGVEQTFESQLRGTYGSEKVEQDAQGRVSRVLDTIQQPKQGDSLELTIDVQTQRIAQKALAWAMNLAGFKRGVFIVMDPQTGEILAMVSLPNYDDNEFAQGISTAAYQKLLRDPNTPLHNYAVQDQFPPGSTYKLVTGSGALADGKITPQTRIQTKAFLSLGKYKYYDWNHAGFGDITIYDGFAHSSDTFFFQLAGMLGIDRLSYWAHEWGFGEKTGVDLPNEAAGIVPSNAWKERVFNGQPIYPGETYQAGIGQGYDMVTPLQLIDAYSALANGGKLYRPQIVRRVLDANGNVVQDFQPDLIRTLPISQSVLQTMRVAARNVPVSRHTYNLVDLPVVMAGKSGTAEFGIRDKQGRLPFHSWFVGFTPKDWHKHPATDPNGFEAVKSTDSQLAFLAFAYDSRTVGNAATEIVKYFLQMYYHTNVDLRIDSLLTVGNHYGN
jgi:penicillin-binding protein 2